MEPMPGGRLARAGLSVFACYDQLRREIQALLAENEELVRTVGRLQEQRVLRHRQHGAGPSSAPPLAPAPGYAGGQFAFPSAGGDSGEPPHRHRGGKSPPPHLPPSPRAAAHGSEWELAPLEQSHGFQAPHWEQQTQDSALPSALSAHSASDITSGVFFTGTGNRSI